MARVILGVTGGIAAYKACELVRLLVRAGHEVMPVLTPDAERFVTARTFEALARRERPRDLYPHLVRADLLLIAPLSANTLAKLAHGLADNVLTELALAYRGPVLAAPAMNARMWEHPATQANAALVRGRGIELFGPETGELAEGERGVGRMSEPPAIAARVAVLLGASGALRGRSVVVTAGGPREPLDTVRYLGNRSSGRMGVAIAAEAQRRGADVTLLAANLAVPAPTGVDVVATPTAADLEREALARAGADVIVMAAAVADYRPAGPLATKRKKDGRPWTVELEPTADILARLGGSRRPGQVLVGFAADEGPSGLASARAKRERKGVDLVVFNDVSVPGIGFEADDNEVTLVRAAGERRVEKASKDTCAVAILDEIEALLGGG
ncbi:MAG: bifunctional phosphopantothenoylcysteine decarboxylase/phosphopantothenate--cysteine ligase CoaBC [Thermoleophilia bacterium]|nr:bifunctional phosphopantothenoylcysteine decarboxylase/phosphopantothenate--cysteine ligase CoaBC [Thermoleophilia bacterium]